ncbi:MAG: hypothetical protein E4H27_06310 [Anaerolineales bacterium]|nr:MAG: hypothetical protein E4H27_06310 [Anaerolineales bacterium]
MDKKAAAVADLSAIIASAKRLGVELDEEEALQWLAAMAVQNDSDIVVDEETGVFGHQVTMLDFSSAQLAHFRAVGRIVEFEDSENVETALALSGSAAQSKIQTYPGDADYFERVNILAPTKEEACRILGKIMREKVLASMRGPTYQLIEVKLGSYPYDFVKEGELIKAALPISWAAAEAEDGKIEGFLPDGTPATITWEEAAQDPGWCKLDWVIADPERGTLANASNMLDVTWEAPDGAITPLDGYLDPYFQEVYLEAESIPLFSKLAKHVSENALDDYVHQLEKEVRKYVTLDPLNYGKAAKRMYNIFRLTGKYEEAVYLRELFDEPATMLYQVYSLIRTVDDAAKPGNSISKESMMAQTDALILAVIGALEGDEETEIVKYLLRLRDSLADIQIGSSLTAEAEAARAEVINIVNNFCYEKLAGVPTLKAYIDNV